MSYVFMCSKELRFACWSDIDLHDAIWTVPSKHIEKQCVYVVSLARLVVSLLLELYGMGGIRRTGVSLSVFCITMHY